jgi:hypothetical protein
MRPRKPICRLSADKKIEIQYAAIIHGLRLFPHAIRYRLAMAISKHLIQQKMEFRKD